MKQKYICTIHLYIVLNFIICRCCCACARVERNTDANVYLYYDYCAVHALV